MGILLLPSFLTFLSLAAAPVAAAPGQTQTPPARQRELPPVSWTCPMHPEVVEDKPGRCPICKMNLAPVRLDLAWSCPIHTTITEAQSGKCPICQRDLVPITVLLFWTCPGSDKHELTAGRCPDRSQRIAVRERRAHGDHNPRHGGQLFMAPNNWHHIEGTYPSAGLLRIFIYDDFTRPLPLGGIAGRVVTRETFDPAAKQTKEIEAFPLRRSENGQYLEARIGSAALPSQVTAKIRFTPNGNEYRFDFSFPEYTREPPAGGLLTSAARAPAAPAGVSGSDESLRAQLQAHSKEVDRLIGEGAFTAVWIPALAAKDLALELEQRSNDAPEAERLRVAAAVKRLALAAWLLDMYGDLGDRTKLIDAYRSFSAAVAELAIAHGTR